MSPWSWLAIAATVEIAWSQSIKPTEGFSRPLPTLLCFLLTLAVIYPLTRAVEGIPVGTAYAIFTGVGAVGAVALGVIVSGDSAGAGRLAALALVIAGVVMLRIAEGS
jgi:quaternary ammonium compound-resistance protein SugE